MCPAKNSKSSPKDQVMPNGKWTFDEEVTGAFDDMLERSIPQYRLMRETVLQVAKRFNQPKTDIVDLGCARGEALSYLVKEFGAKNRFLGLEISEPMLKAARKRFKHYCSTGIVEIRQHDLRNPYPNANA